MKTTREYKALIIDNDYDICSTLSFFLDERNITSAFAVSLSSARIALEKSTPSLIFLDNYLSDGLGIDFVPYLTLNHPATKVIMITGDTTIFPKGAPIPKGLFDIVFKPFTIGQINAILDKTLFQEK